MHEHSEFEFESLLSERINNIRRHHTTQSEIGSYILYYNTVDRILKQQYEFHVEYAMHLPKAPLVETHNHPLGLQARDQLCPGDITNTRHKVHTTCIQTGVKKHANKQYNDRIDREKDDRVCGVGGRGVGVGRECE